MSLSIAQLQEVTPSVFTTEPSPKLSSKYNFVPTFEILENFEREGWHVSSAKQVGKGRYSTHELRLRNGGLPQVGDSLVARGSAGDRPFVPGVPVGVVVTVNSNASSITQNADVESATNLEKISIVAVVTAAAKGDPRDSLIPKPRPTATVYVTPTPTPSPSE
jgi:hypothetical protein